MAKVARRIRPSRWAAALLGILILIPACGPAAERARVRRFVRDVVTERGPDLGASHRDAIARAVLAAEDRHGVDALLLLAVMHEESRFDPEAHSRRGAVGLMQLRLPTARAVGGRHGIEVDAKDDLLEPRVNVALAAAYLAELHERFESWDLALTAYNHGPTRARRLARRGRNPSSGYSSRVLEDHRRLRGELEQYP